MEKIIVQDTDAGVLDVLTQALEFENFQVYAIREFDNRFMAIIEEFRPHVIMLDYRLSGKRTIEILNEIKDRYTHLPIIALSCNHNINTVAIEAGFDDYIRKPFDLDLLYRILRKHIPKKD
jgi:DNA-binding response OmpR family regulator